jgi:hypothetical protein
MQSIKAIFLASAAVSFLFVAAASAQEHPNREHQPQPRPHHHALRMFPPRPPHIPPRILASHQAVPHAGGGVKHPARQHLHRASVRNFFPRTPLGTPMLMSHQAVPHAGGGVKHPARQHLHRAWLGGNAPRLYPYR